MLDQTHLLNKLLEQVQTLRRKIEALDVSEEQFQDWFDGQLFKTTHSAPEQYCDELTHNIRQLEGSQSASQQEYLALRIEQQLLALSRAVAFFQTR